MTPDPKVVLRIARLETHRAVRRHPYRQRWFDDLVQDAAEGFLVGWRRVPAVSYARRSARGALARCALRYAGIDERSGRTPLFVASAVLERIGTPDPLPAFELARAVRSGLDSTVGRTRRILTATLDGANVKEVAASEGISRQAVYDHYVKAQLVPQFREAA